MEKEASMFCIGVYCYLCLTASRRKLSQVLIFRFQLVGGISCAPVMFEMTFCDEEFVPFWSKINCLVLDTGGPLAIGTPPPPPPPKSLLGFA